MNDKASTPKELSIKRTLVMPAPAGQDAEFRHLLDKARDAKRGGQAAWSVQSTGEKIAVALALNKPDWLASVGYTLVEAIDRTGPEWIALLPRVERALREDL